MILYGEAQNDMEERIVIREANIKDADTLLKFHHAIYKYHADRVDFPLEDEGDLLDRIKEDFKTKYSTVFLASLKTSISSVYVGFIEIRADREKRTCYIRALWTTPEARGRGVATRLMNVASVYAKEKGCNTISLDVYDFNTEARALYEKLGYKEKDHTKSFKATLEKKL